VNVSPLFPSNNKLMYIFLEYFQKRELYYKTDMKKCVSVTKAISCDHTLKIRKYISARRERNDKSVKHFQKLFIVLKERHQIIIWWLTRTTLFDEIRTFLVGLKKNLSNKLNNIVVDDYCKVRALHQFVFLGVEVKLHLFHAVQRVSKNSRFSKKLSEDMGMIFRQNGNCCKVREMATPFPAVILENLDNFKKKVEFFSKS